MAEQILTQVEVDALLKGLSNGDIKTEADRVDEDKNEVRAYDFSSRERAVRGRIPTLEMLNEKFSRSARSSIFNLLRKSVDIAPDGVKVMKYEEFIRNLQVPSSLNVFQLYPLRGSGLLAIDPNLVFMIVDSYFGGDGRFQTRIEGRDFTNVEQAVVKKVVEVIFTEMKEIWKPVHPLDFRLIRSEMNPQFLNIIGHSEYVVVSTFRMDLESISNKFFMCIPYTSLEPIKDKLYGTQQVDSTDMDKKWSANLKEQFGTISVDFAAEVGTANIYVSELVNLKAGDIIQLNRKIKDPLEISIEGIPKFLGTPGVIDNHYSIKIHSAIKERG